MWNLMWNKTTVDEKTISFIQEVKRRGRLTTQELKDVVKAFKQVGDQIGDIDDAVKGKKRKGRKIKK